jgi:Tfp pilus assembly PilM family ATPase
MTITRLGYGETSSSLHAASFREPDARQDVAEVIGEMCRQNDLTMETPVLCVDDRTLLFKRIPLDPVVTKWASEQVMWEMSKMLPKPEEYTIDSHLTVDAGYAVALRRTVIDLYLDICHRAGFQPLIIDVHPFALSNVYLSFLKESRKEVLALLSFEEEFTVSAMIQNGKLLCASILPVNQVEGERSEEEIDERGQGTGTAPASEGRGLMAEEGADQASDLMAEEGADQASDLMAEGKEHSLVSHLHHLLSETSYARRGPSFDRIFLCGAFCDVEKHGEILAGESQTPPEVVDPFHFFEIGRIAQERQDLIAQGYLFTVASGLACRGLDEQ